MVIIPVVIALEYQIVGAIYVVEIEIDEGRVAIILRCA